MHENRFFISCLSKRKITIVLYTLFLLLFGLSTIQAESILEGTLESSSGSSQYIANVESEETYASVFGVKGNNTDCNSYGVVNINGGTVTGTVYGNRAISGEKYVHAISNVVNITGGSVGTVYGGYAYGGTNNANVQNNNVNINGGIITGYVYGGNADGETISVTGNNVRIKNATINKSVYGACAFNTDSWLSMLRNNVIIENSNISGSVYGGYASGSATASNNNTVTIKGNTKIKGSVYGGYSLSNNSDAKNNTVIIEGGTISNHIYGAIGRNAKGNTIVIKGGDLSGAHLYGYSDGRKSHSENTLEIWTDVKVKSAQNFENYFFMVPDGISNNNDKFMLSVDTPVNLSDANVAIAMQNGTVLNVGDTINLIDKAEGTPTLINLEDCEIKGGTLLTVYDFNLVNTGSSLAAIATSEGKNISFSGPTPPAGQAIPEAKSLGGGMIASVSLLNEGNDLALNSDFSDAGMCFLNADYGKSRYYADSHIDMNKTGLAVGIAKKFSNLKLQGTVGIFFESGNGNYSTFNSFESGSVFGNGKAQYYGGGLVFQLKPAEKKGLHIHATGHVGNISNEWTSDDFNEDVSYATDNLFFSTAVKFGYQGSISKKFNYDIYSKSSWTHMKGNDADINGEILHFDSINSIKTGLGINLAYDGKSLKPFFLFEFEREFNGEAKAKVNACSIDTSSLKGNSALFELGVNYIPQRMKNWQLELSVSGYTGIRHTLKGSAVISYNF